MSSTSLHQTDRSARKQVQLGKRLAREKQLCFASGGVWRTFVKDHCSMSRERADELIRIGRGVLSVDEARATKKATTRTSRAKKDHSKKKAELMKLVQHANATCSKIALRRTKIPGNERGEIDAAIRDAFDVWQNLRKELASKN